MVSIFVKIKKSAIDLIMASAIKKKSVQNWQCVMVCFGNKFSGEDINRIVRHVKIYSPTAVRFVLLTDAVRLDVGLEVKQIIIPDFYLQDRFKTGGVHVKLALYEENLLPQDMVAIYVDLDTAIVGDLARALKYRRNERSIMMLHHVIIPFGAFGRLIFRISGGKKYARGNSSMVVFHPMFSGFIAKKFKSSLLSFEIGSKPELNSDEHFLSWAAQDVLQTIPSSIMSKFQYEFMSVVPGWMVLRCRLPWTRAKWRRMAAVTFPDPACKPEIIQTLKQGDVIVDRKKRRLVWDDNHLSFMRQKIINYFT